MRTYERFGEAVRVTLGTAAIAGLICLLLAVGRPRPFAWIFLLVSLVAAAAWFYMADRNWWRDGIKIAGQFGIVIVGLAASLSLVLGSGWVLLGGLVLAGLATALLLLIDDGPGSDLGGPVD